MTKSTLEVLVDARKLIEREENWTKDACARDANGEHVDSSSDLACAWCALGAIGRAVGTEAPIGDAYSALLRQTNHSVSGFNDTHTHAEVLAAFDRAIEAERSKVSA